MKKLILSFAIFASFSAMAQEATKAAVTKAAVKKSSKAATKVAKANAVKAVAPIVVEAAAKAINVAPPPPPPPPPMPEMPTLGPDGKIVNGNPGAHAMPVPELPVAPVSANDLPKVMAPMAPMAPVAPKQPSVALTSVAKFNNEVIDMGKIPQNKPVTVDFTFQNIGKTPLVVENASGSCGCTVPTKPELPILPKKSDKVSATFNAAAMGAFTKTVTVKFAGVDEAKVLTIKGEVVAAQ